MKTLFRLAITVVVAGLGLAAIGVAVVPQVAQIVTAKRIGIDYAKEWKDAPLRFLDANQST